MIHHSLSSFQKNVVMFKKVFRSSQSSLESLINCSLTSDDDLALYRLWLNDKTIKSLINSFCVSFLGDQKTKINPQDLQQYKVSIDECKIQMDNEKNMENCFNKKYGKNTINQLNNSVLNLQGQQNESFSQESSEQNSTSKKQYKRGPYKNYTVQQKEEAVRMLVQDHFSVIQISRKLQIPCKNIKRWAQQGVFRKKGGGRKRFSPETEKSVSEYLKRCYSQGSQVTYESVQDIARMLSDDQAFKASRGWVVKFVDRQHLKNYYRFI